jgi:hypothetical protein
MTLQIFDVEQNSPEWMIARCGIVTASTFAKVLAQGKDGGASVGRRDLMLKLAGEILTGEPAPEGYRNADMDRGHELEPEARALYALRYQTPTRVGFIRNGRKGASPDSLVGANGGLEIKCAIPSVQIDRLLKGKLPPEHVAQVQGSLWVSEREHWDFMSYCPGLPPLVIRVARDEPYIAKLAAAVDAFNDELDSIVASIRTYQDFRAAAAA